MRLMVLTFILACSPLARAACEMVPHPTGSKYLECDPVKVKEAKDAATRAALTTPPPKPGHQQSVEEFKANMDALNATTDAERAEAKQRAEAARTAEHQRKAHAIAKEDAELKSSGTSGAWVAKVVENRMDNTARLLLMLEGKEPLPNRIRPKPPILVIRCERGKVDLYVNAGTHIHDPAGEIYGISFRAKFDDAAPIRLKGEKSTSYDSVFFPSPKAYVKKLRGTRTLLIEVTPYGFAEASTKFVVTGLDQHRAEVQKHCGV